MIETSEEQVAASTLRRRLSELTFSEADPENLWALAQACGYDVDVSWSAQGAAACFDARLSHRSRAGGAPRAISAAPKAPKSWRTYANDPLENGLRQQLIPQLREHLKSRLPDYMVPSAWMVLKQLPLTPNGKLDRRALPVPQSRGQEFGEYIAPRTKVESTLADIWAQVLQVDRVGIEDDFFDIGGHSLLAMQVIVRIRSALSIDVPMRLLFESPTIRRLASRVDELRQAGLLDDMEDGGDDFDELLEQVAAMPESKVAELMRELRPR